MNDERNYERLRAFCSCVEGPMLESHSGQDWKTLTVHPAVDGHLTFVGEG